MINDWETTSIGEVAKPILRAETPLAGTTYRQIGVRLWGQGAYERESIDGSQTKYATLSRVESGDIVVNKIWARNGSVAVVSDKLSGCFGSGEFPTFAPDRNKLEPKWFHWMTKTKWFWQACDEKSQGTSGKNRIRPEKFLEIEIPLPSLYEQRRIVEHIETISACISKAQSLRDEADEEANVFIASLSNQVLNRLNAEEVSLGSIVIHARNGFGRRPTTEEKGPIVLRLADVSTGNISLANPRRIEMTEDEFREFEVRTGDIIFVRVNGSLPIIGRCIPCDIDFQEKVAYNDHLIRARVDTTKLYSRYATLWLNSPDMRKMIQSKAITTAGQYSISQTSILGLPIKLPPLDEQRRIVAYLDSVQARLASLRELQSQTGEELSALLPSVLDRAFKGEL